MVAKNATIYPGAEIEEGVTIEDYAVIYPNVVIKRGTTIWPHCVIGKRPMAPEGILHRQLKNHYGPTIIGGNCVVGVGSVIYQGVVIGDNCLLGDYCSIREEVSIGNYCLISRFVSLNYGIHIGNHVRIFECTHITGDVEIEDDVTISAGVLTNNDKYMDGLHNQRGPTILRGASIGMGAILMADTIVGEHSFVGAGALVRHNVPSHAVAYGLPAKVIEQKDG